LNDEIKAKISFYRKNDLHYDDFSIPSEDVQHICPFLLDVPIIPVSIKNRNATYELGYLLLYLKKEMQDPIIRDFCSVGDIRPHESAEKEYNHYIKKMDNYDEEDPLIKTL
jgi:hypothetical protein